MPELDLVTLSRLHFGITTVYHFLFVPLTLGLSVFVAMFETLGFIKKDDDWTKLAKFFGTLFLINFAMGVATGIVQEFQFGMNWSDYSRFVGDIFGAPLAIEALAAFFLESTFLGIWMFGREKLPRMVHVGSIWVVAIASNLSALWILIANSFMQNPVGYAIRNGRAEMTSFLELITNSHIFVQFPHVFTAGLSTAAIFILAVSAFKILVSSDTPVFRKSFRFGIVASLLSLVAVAAVGDLQGKYLVKHQPMKMAAAEALWETEAPAALSLFATIDEKNHRDNINIAIPRMLSFMSYSNFSGEVKGINELQKEMEAEFGPGNYTPPVTLCYWMFRIMVGAGTAGVFAALGLLVLLFFKKGKFSEIPLVLLGSIALLPIPYIANSAGWILTEMGRQPWIVYKVLLVTDGVSKAVSSGAVLATLIGFTVLYGVLAIVDVYLLGVFINKDIAEVEHD